jgi:ATP-dependent helicase STH1/SNF2
MKNQGENDSNPRFVQLSAQLLAIQRAQTIKSAQQQQHQARPGNPGQPAATGPGPVAQQASPMMNASQRPQENGIINGIALHDDGLTPGVTQPAPAPARPALPQSFTPDQLNLLKNQILAFKKISKNLPLPEAVQSTVIGPLHSTPQPETQPPQQTSPVQAIQAAQETLAAATRVMESAPPAKTASPIPQLSSEEPPLLSPHQFFRRKITLADHSRRDQRPLIPAIFPVGIDHVALQELQDRAREGRISARIQELESLDANLVDFPQDGQVRRESYSQSSKLRAIIELKSLKMLEKQRLLRKVMSRAIGRMTHLSTSPDRALYRRQKKVSLREARLTENLERQQRVDRERREKQKHDDYLQGILQHGRELLTNGRLRVQRWQRLGKAVVSYHSHVEKEEQRRIERTAKLRLAALKNDDEEAYLKLVDQAKDTRITHLLKQTSSYLDGLAAAVAKQQLDSGYPSATAEGESDDEDADNKIDYYAVAHRIKEEVTEQPNMLVGGKLKDYQVKGLQWMVSLYNNHLNGILADEMGLGKTIQTISLITFLMEKKQTQGPFLVIVPLSTMTNWSLEFQRWAPTVKVICYKGAPAVRRNLSTTIRQGGWQVLLTTYEFVIKDRAILSKTKWIYMIIDEGHRMKNTKSKLALTLQQYYYARYRLILTGTPLQNNLPELWAILNFALPKIFNSVKSFDEWFNTPFANTGAQDEMKLTEEETILIVKRLHKVLRPFLLRRLKRDVESELPNKVERVVKCRMSSLQSRLYAQMKAEGIISSDGGYVSFFLGGVDL